VKTSLRRATDSDWRAFYGNEPPEGWVGFCAECQDEITAFGYVWVDGFGRTWVGTDNARAVPLLMLHRAIAALFRALQEEGIDTLYALCDERIPKAAKWLTRMGFAIEYDIASVYLAEVDKCLPVWRRRLGGVEP
jgi:hypothetical protein